MPTQEPQHGDLSGRSTVLPVAEVVDIIREWVDLQARHLPHFAGAYLWGGITALPADAPFPLYRDVDVVVVTEGAHDENQEISYQGLMLEVIALDLAAHRDAKAVLANPSHGPNMATTQILADPTRILVPLQQAVAMRFGRRRWIRARCEGEKASAERSLAAMRQASTPVEILDSVREFLGALSGLLAVAQLERPTTRRTLALLCELLEARGRLDLHEAALTLMGCAHLSRADVQAMQDQSVIAFDRAVEVYRTPTPYGFTMRTHLRPYHVEGTQEMIDEGNHREAVFWITCLDTAYSVFRARSGVEAGIEGVFRQPALFSEVRARGLWVAQWSRWKIVVRRVLGAGRKGGNAVCNLPVCCLLFRYCRWSAWNTAAGLCLDSSPDAAS